jgi:A/G-specific adenine glycosylase
VAIKNKNIDSLYFYVQDLLLPRESDNSVKGKKKESRAVPLKKNIGHNGLTPQAVRAFRTIIYKNYWKNPRILPWRKTRNPYRILVSEIMLQQTQVERVLRKYRLFVKKFPNLLSLAEAPLKDILTVWQGLGYNRRAISLKNIAETIVTNYGGKIPSSQEALIKLPGIGRYTAAAIETFAFNKPTTIIETNIRSVYIYFFFQARKKVKDSEIISLIEKTLDKRNPREWYYALMDYGVILKKTYANLNKKSAHYHRQTPFRGSNRQMRGMILKALVEQPGLSEKELLLQIGFDPEKISNNLKRLEYEGFLRKKGKRYTIA